MNERRRGPGFDQGLGSTVHRIAFADGAQIERHAFPRKPDREVLCGEFDQVIFDGPPALLVSDALVLAGALDGVVLVCRAKAVSRGGVLRAREQMERANIRIFGAVLNADFDYVKYLDTLAADKLNLTRTWTGGIYCEPAGAFNIARNTLAPLAGLNLSKIGDFGVELKPAPGASGGQPTSEPAATAGAKA